MTQSDPIITGVDIIELPTHYPRTVGRNARLGSHGSGGTSRFAVLQTDTAAIGWGLIEQAGDTSMIIGRPLSELIDAASGVRQDTNRWLDVALHDLLGVVDDLPVWAMLGAAGDRTTEVYDGAIYFDDLDPEQAPRGPEVALENCRTDAGLGHVNFKLKIGRGNRWMPRAEGDARDIEITRAVRKSWPDAKILVDANDGYDMEGFCRYLEATADCDLYWVEEPFLDDADDLAALRSLRDKITPDTKIAEGETSPDVDVLMPIADRGDIDVLLMDVISFGVTRWRHVMPSLMNKAVQASPHAWGRPVKTLYAAQLAAGLGKIPIIEGVPGTTDGVDDSAYEFVDGRLTVPERPGFGLPVPIPE